MKKTFCLLFLVLTINFASDDVADYLKNQNSQITKHKKQEVLEIEKQKQEFIKYTHQSRSEFNKWQASRKKELQEFKKQITKSWGDYIDPSNKVWVEYSKDKTSVLSVDFKEGRASVSVLVNADASKEHIKEKVEKALFRTITSKGSNDFRPVEKEKAQQRLSSPILEKQVVDNAGDVVTVKSVSKFAEGLVEEAKITKTDTMLKVAVSFDLAPDHLKKRIERVLPCIIKYCEKYNLNVARVLATVHTESHFNPMALSSSNAIGLMQLVPIYGAWEAYRFVYGIDAVPKEGFLYNPENNIRLGCAYIYLLKNNYFSPVDDEIKQRYCTIAAYNTGPKNVAYAFTRDKSVDRAATVINSMENPQTVYDHLLNNLPYRETKRYLAEVTEKMKLYK